MAIYNFSNNSPPAPPGAQNVAWQDDDNKTPTNISGNVPAAGRVNTGTGGSPPGDYAISNVRTTRQQPDWRTVATNVAGYGLVSSLVGLLLKRKLDHALEVQKAFLARASRVHERQVETLTKLYEQLYKNAGLPSVHGRFSTHCGGKARGISPPVFWRPSIQRRMNSGLAGS